MKAIDLSIYIKLHLAQHASYNHISNHIPFELVQIIIERNKRTTWMRTVKTNLTIGKSLITALWLARQNKSKRQLTHCSLHNTSPAAQKCGNIDILLHQLLHYLFLTVLCRLKNTWKTDCFYQVNTIWYLHSYLNWIKP